MAILCPSHTSASSNPPYSSKATTSQPPVSLSKRGWRGVRSPAKNSLYDILRQHSRTSLFVHPICWSDLHAQLLGTQWEELPPCTTPRPASIPGSPPSNGHLHPSRTIMTLSDSLTKILLPDTIFRSNAVKTALATLWPEPFRKIDYLPEFSLYFGGRMYRQAVGAQFAWNLPSNETKSSYSSFQSVLTPYTPSQLPANRPMICYIGKSQLALRRMNLYGLAPDLVRTFNKPVYRLQQLRAKSLLPSDSDQDVYFVGLFLAMAQRHFYQAPAPSPKTESPIGPKKEIPPSPNFQNVTLRILTHDRETSEFIVYTGYVTKEFLKKFHDPLSATPGDDEAAVSGIKIEYARVPIWPILGLRERLGGALGHGVVGDFNINEMETWETDQGVTKRKHVVSNSGSAASKDRPPPAKKRLSSAHGIAEGLRVLSSPTSQSLSLPTNAEAVLVAHQQTNGASGLGFSASLCVRNRLR